MEAMLFQFYLPIFYITPLADLSHVSLKHVQGCKRRVKNPSFEVLRAFCKVLNLSLDSLMNLDLPEDEQARALTDELKEMVQTAGAESDKNLEDK